MGILFATDEWARALMAALNDSDRYRKDAAKWEGDFYFVVEQGGAMDGDAVLYFDLWHGACREAYLAADTGAQSPAFELSAPLATWRDVLEGKLDPIRGITSRKLRLKGNLIKVIKAPKAAVAMVEVASSLATDWP